MTLSRRWVIFSAAATVPALTLGSGASAGTVVTVSLWDKGATSMDAMGSAVPMGMAMPGAKMEAATMGITADVVEIPAGEVTFAVINESGEFYHSMVISKIEDQSKELPYLADTMTVDEEAAGRTAVLKELRPHDSGSVTVDMKRGHTSFIATLPATTRWACGRP